MTMEKPMNVCVLVGSLRKASLNGMLANALMSLAPPSMKLEKVEIGQLPFFNQDLETAATPAQWTAFRQSVKDADAVLFVTPEYNRSVPPALKNALDVGSRPYGSSVWDRKPGAIVSCSPSAVGAFGANHHLRQSLVFLNVPTMQQPEAYIGHADKLFDEQGKLVNDGTRKFLQGFMQAFANWVETIRSQGSVPDDLRQARASAASG
jgi:chromate reductase, NAD(P)H dehydrogenase (quinone)